MALSLSESVGGLKFMANVAKKANKIVIEKKVVLILFNQHQFTDPVILKLILVRLMCQGSKKLSCVSLGFVEG